MLSISGSPYLQNVTWAGIKIHHGRLKKFGKKKKGNNF